MLALVLILLSCNATSDTAGGADPIDGCVDEADPQVTMYFDSDTCAAIDYECAASEVSFSDDCGCGCVSDG